MALDFNRPASTIHSSDTQHTTEPMEDYQQFDIVADRQQMTQLMVNSPEVDKLTSQIEVYNLETIVSFGANAAGKTNLMRAIIAALIIIRTSETRQINNPIPLIDQFAFSKDGTKETSFELEFSMGENRYIYGFSCTSHQITEEHLTTYSSRRPTRIFTRKNNEYEFYNSEAREQLQPLVQRNTPNKLFIATATIWNSELTKQPYLWLRNCIDVFDSENATMQSLELYESDKTGKLRSFTNNLLKEADINISDFTVESREIKNAPPLFLANYPAVQKEYKVMAMHTIKSINKDVSQKYLLPMQSESKGTQNLFFLLCFVNLVHGLDF